MRLREAVTLLFVAIVENGCGRALASLLGIQTSISPRPRFAQEKYGIAVKLCSLFSTLPCASKLKPKDLPVMVVTPFSKVGLNSAVSLALSGKSKLRTRAFGL